MRNGQFIIDTDTHFQPSAESVLPYLTGEYAARMDEWEKAKTPIRTGRAGHVMPEPYRHWLRFRSCNGGGGWAGNGPRRLGEAGKATDERSFQKFMGSRFPTIGTEDFDLDTRIKEMDEEGVDMQVMVPSAFGGHEDPKVDMEFIRALHRYLDDQTSVHPGRLYSLLQLTGRDIPGSLEEMKRNRDSKWAVGIQVNLPQGYPMDHPDLEPIWKQAAEQDLTVIHHSGGSGYPGERDLWDNPFMGRLASHPWGAMRFVASLMGAGVMDRYPTLRLAVLESGFGWLPFWGRRTDDQVHYMGYVSPDLKHSMWEHMTGGRFFAAVVIHEGEDMVKLVNQAMGDHVLMYSSDYPHAESRFPNSTDIVLAWKLGDEERKKLFSGNALQCFRRANVLTPA